MLMHWTITYMYYKYIYILPSESLCLVLNIPIFAIHTHHLDVSRMRLRHNNQRQCHAPTTLNTPLTTQLLCATNVWGCVSFADLPSKYITPHHPKCAKTSQRHVEHETCVGVMLFEDVNAYLCTCVHVWSVTIRSRVSLRSKPAEYPDFMYMLENRRNPIENLWNCVFAVTESYLSL